MEVRVDRVVWIYCLALSVVVVVVAVAFFQGRRIPEVIV